MDMQGVLLLLSSLSSSLPSTSIFPLQQSSLNFYLPSPAVFPLSLWW
uniref:Uncharacterized protein n=1 Tax=Manihot esculenta TaxID=3983 RepID=A0A2C9W4B3_MANES